MKTFLNPALNICLKTQVSCVASQKSSSFWVASGGKLPTETFEYKNCLRVIDGLAVCLGGSFVWCVCVCDISPPQLTALCEASPQHPSLSSTVVWTASSCCFITPGVEWSMFAFSQTLRVKFLMMLSWWCTQLSEFISLSLGFKILFCGCYRCNMNVGNSGN